MPRYIDADALDEIVQYLNEMGWGITRNDYKRIDRVLFEMPTIDAVEVVRCKNCKYLEEDECPWTGVIDRNGYCSRGERKEDVRLVMPPADGSTIKIGKMDEVEDSEIHGR